VTPFFKTFAVTSHINVNFMHTMMTKHSVLALLLLSLVDAFVVVVTTTTRPQSCTLNAAAPKRLEDNVDGVLYVNDRCIDCAACSHFNPSVFKRGNGHHFVYAQPSIEEDIVNARAAIVACPVAAIRVDAITSQEQETMDFSLAKNLALSQKLNGRDLPFPRPLTSNVWYLGHHNEHSFGATPYLTSTTFANSGDNDNKIWIMVDTPRCIKSAIQAVTTLTGPNGPDYLFLTHVDDTADHAKWKDEFPHLKRIFHVGDLGQHNWVGDLSLENVEVLLQETSSSDDSLQAFDLDGKVLTQDEADNSQQRVVLYHTPGHSPGSISLFQKSDNNGGGVLFTGDTLGYTTRTSTLTGFPNYGNDLRLQKEIVQKIEKLPWDVVAPGHGHARDYTAKGDMRSKELQDAKAELEAYAKTH
jgi:glyoxylase-like metal-dependent hydrolase (beta-lactamase superfamily II)/ferredoxin